MSPRSIAYCEVCMLLPLFLDGFGHVVRIALDYQESESPDGMVGPETFVVRRKSPHLIPTTCERFASARDAR